MKKLIFIDDNEKINKKQNEELKQLLKEYSLNDEIEVDFITLSLERKELDDSMTLSVENVRYVDEKIEKITNMVLSAFESKKEKVELVIDLSLDDEDPKVGIELVKKLVRDSKLSSYFISNKLLITLTSMYISADFDRLSKGDLTDQEIGKILYCHRPIKNELFDKQRYAFPEYYMKFKGNVSNDDVKKLLCNKTYYGNFFGLIIARLICAEG